MMRESVTTLRNRVVKDWRKRNHTQSELDGIELYLNDGDPKHLPSIYRSSHDHWFPKRKSTGKHKIIRFDEFENTARCICWENLRLVSFETHKLVAGFGSQGPDIQGVRISFWAHDKRKRHHA